MTLASTTSLRQAAITDVISMVRAAGFADAEALAAPLIGVVDDLHSYTEEGVRLYPELLVTTSLSMLLAPIPARRIVQIGEAPVELAFRRALKSCAPLARSGWVIFLEVSEGAAKYGVVSAESTELSPTLYVQIVGDLASKPSPAPVLYLRGVASRQVELRTGDKRHRVSLKLEDFAGDDDQLSSFTTMVVASVPENRRPIAEAFVRRLLEEAIRQSHGCLLAVVDADVDACKGFRAFTSDGTYLTEPIDFLQLLEQSDDLRSREASTAVRAYTELVKGMVGFDGLTVFSSKAQVLAYNVFVSRSASEMPVIGGARRRALEAIHASGCVRACLAASHDGALTLRVR